MDGDVDPALEQGVVQLAGEQALAADVRQGLVQHLVTGGLDDDDLQGTLVAKVGELGLQGWHGRDSANVGGARSIHDRRARTISLSRVM